MERLSEGSPQAYSQFFHVDGTLQELSFFYEINHAID